MMGSKKKYVNIDKCLAWYANVIRRNLLEQETSVFNIT